MSKDLEFQPSFKKSKFRTKKMWVEAAYRFSIFSANRIPCLCVFACDDNNITHCLCEIDLLFRSIENTNSFSFFCTLKFELINVVGDTFSFIAFSIEHYAYVKCW